MKYLIVKVLHDKISEGQPYNYKWTFGNEIGENLYMRVISHFLIILYFVNNILRNKKSSSFYDKEKDRGSCTERPLGLMFGLLLYKQLNFIILAYTVNSRARLR